MINTAVFIILLIVQSIIYHFTFAVFDLPLNWIGSLIIGIFGETLICASQGKAKFFIVMPLFWIPLGIVLVNWALKLSGN